MLYTARNSAVTEMIDKKPVHACAARLPPKACLAIMRVPGRLPLAIGVYLANIIRNSLTCNTHEGETNDKVAIDTMKENDFVSNRWNKLEKDEERCGKNSEKMDHHANFVMAFLIVVTFARGRRTPPCISATEDIAITEEHHSGESESQEGSVEYTPCMNGLAQSQQS
jgi:hypothetical protein